MLFRDQLTGRLFDVSAAQFNEFNRGLAQNGIEWLSRLLTAHHEQGNITLIDETRAVVKTTRKKAVEKAPPPPELSFPIIPETDDAGNKRLYKTRYALLEKKFADLNTRYNRLEYQYEDAVQTAEAYSEDVRRLDRRVNELELLTADSAQIEKRMTQIAREMKLEMQLHPYAALGEKLEAFLGAVLCRVRNVEEEADELAD
jgi:hypothetical protein